MGCAETVPAEPESSSDNFAETLVADLGKRRSAQRPTVLRQLL
jgi:hypothetical protein